MSLNQKCKKIYNEIYKDPIPANIEWSDIETLFRALGAEISEGNGSNAGSLPVPGLSGKTGLIGKDGYPAAFLHFIGIPIVSLPSSLMITTLRFQ